MEPVSEDLGLLLVEQFREQMNNLAAAVQLLMPVVQEKGGRQYEPYLAILHQSMYRMMRMLGNLEYLQLPEGELTAERASLDLAGLCRTLGEQVASLARQAGLSFTYEEERGSLITTGDAPQLRRMLLGLISNAFRAAGKGGHTGLRLAVRQDRAVLTVWDDGPGLPPPEERGSRAVVSLPIQPPEGGTVLRTPRADWDRSGGFSDLMVELSAVLPYEAFLPAELE